MISSEVKQFSKKRPSCYKYKIEDSNYDQVKKGIKSILEKEIKHTHASEASKIVPNVQKVEKTTIHLPLLSAGTNSRNQVVNTEPPPRPTPTKKRKLNNTM